MPSRFSDEWARAWCEALNASAHYRDAAARWEGAVLLQVDEAAPDPSTGHPAVFLDLHHGSCRTARQARPGDEETARFVLSGATASWEEVLRGEVAPTVAIMRGRITLMKGSLMALLPHVGAATALVRVAQAIDTDREEQPVVPTGLIRSGLDIPPPSTGVNEVPVAASSPPFATTSPAGLDWTTPPLRLWEKAKRLGIWNPADIDFSRDRDDWVRLRPHEQDFLLRLASLFQGGEEAVTVDILPLIDVMAREGRLEETMYLTSFLFEEAKHVEGMRRFLDATGARWTDLTRYHTPAYRRIFHEELPASMGQLREDHSPVAQARASATYNMIVEGVLAETGYHVFHEILERRDILPGTRRMAVLLKQDESRHIAYGLFLLTRLVTEHGDPVWHAMAERMNTLVDPAVTVITEAFDAYDPADMPFGFTAAPFVEYAMGQFAKRMQRLERARSGAVSEDELEFDRTP